MFGRPHRGGNAVPSDNNNRDDMPADNIGRDEPYVPPFDPRRGVPDPDEPPFEVTLTEEDIREIEASGITLSDVIRELRSQYGM